MSAIEPVFVHLDLSDERSEVCPCGTSLLAADVLHVSDEGVSTFGVIAVEVYTGEPHECPEWSMR